MQGNLENKVGYNRSAFRRNNIFKEFFMKDKTKIIGIITMIMVLLFLITN